MAEKLPGILVTYFPDGAIDGRLTALRREVEPLVVVDNTDEPEARETLRRLVVETGAVWLPQSTNRGTAGALNAAFSRLVADGFDATIVFDQDSTPEAGLASALRRCALGRPRVAVIGSNWRDEARPEAPSRHVLRGRLTRQVARADLDGVAFVIASGSWFSLTAWCEIGPFDEGLFLDLVDTEYCLRAARKGWVLRIAAGARLLHRRGAKVAVSWCGRTWWPANMPPARLHLLARNRVSVLRRYGLREPRWVCFEGMYTAYLLFCALALEDATGAKLRAMMKGFWDGLLGRLGPPEWASPVRPSEDESKPLESRTR